jgi:hypothetical protein
MPKEWRSKNNEDHGQFPASWLSFRIFAYPGAIDGAQGVLRIPRFAAKPGQSKLDKLV